MVCFLIWHPATEASPTGRNPRGERACPLPRAPGRLGSRCSNPTLGSTFANASLETDLPGGGRFCFGGKPCRPLGAYHAPSLRLTLAPGVLVLAVRRGRLGQFLSSLSSESASLTTRKPLGAGRDRAGWAGAVSGILLTPRPLRASLRQPPGKRQPC